MSYRLLSFAALVVLATSTTTFAQGPPPLAPIGAPSPLFGAPGAPINPILANQAGSAILGNNNGGGIVNSQQGGLLNNGGQLLSQFIDGAVNAQGTNQGVVINTNNQGTTNVVNQGVNTVNNAANTATNGVNQGINHNGVVNTGGNNNNKFVFFVD